MHQSWLHYGNLSLATQAHRPDVVVVVGDAFDAFDLNSKHQFTMAECVKILAELSTQWHK
jgi:metallophosphoesterase superfamily enzyme